VIDKEDSAKRTGIFMIDASKGFIKDGNKNRLREQDIRKVVDVWNDQLEIPKYSRFVPNDEIKKNEYNLNIPRYIDTQEPEDIQDIEGHLKGGIPNADIDALEEYWKVCPTLKKALLKPSRSGYCTLAITPDEVRKTIFSHSEFATFRVKIIESFTSWRKDTAVKLAGIDTKDHPKAIIQKISDDILKVFQDAHLLDKYDIYQCLMSYWEDVMQDDTHIITADGWQAGNEVIRLQKDSKGKRKTLRA
jgi:Type I restriction-modification system methyltransferase subunit